MPPEMETNLETISKDHSGMVVLGLGSQSVSPEVLPLHNHEPHHSRHNRKSRKALGQPSYSSALTGPYGSPCLSVRTLVIHSHTRRSFSPKKSNENTALSCNGAGG